MKITVKIVKITFAKIEVFAFISVILRKKAVEVVLPLKQGLKPFLLVQGVPFFLVEVVLPLKQGLKRR